MSNKIRNASPQVISLGTQDLSTRVVTPGPLEIPQHLPKAFVFAKKGPLLPNPVIGGGMLEMYGTETFDPNKKYYNHATRFVNGIVGSGNLTMLQRLVPDDAGAEANMIIYVDLLPTQIPNYVRNSDGTYAIDANTQDYKIDATTPTIAGYEVKIIKEFQTEDSVFGTATTKPGTMSITGGTGPAVRLETESSTVAVRTIGNIVTGSVSGATGEIAEWTDSEGGTILVLINVVGTFTISDELEDGQPTSYVEDITDYAGGGNVRSTMYPVIEVRAAFQGSHYNNVGLCIESLIADDIDTRLIDANKALPFMLSIFNRENNKSTPVVFKSLYGEPSVMFNFAEKSINPLTEARYDLEAVFESNWYNEKNPLLPLKYNDFSGIKVYRDSLETAAGLVMANEAAYITSEDQMWDDGLTASTLSWLDFTVEDDAELIADEKYLLNIFNGKSSKGVNYFTMVVSDETPAITATQKEVTFAKNTPIFMDGSSDGTMSNEMYETLVKREMAKYIDGDSEVIDTAINIESVLYDSGFTLDAKKELCNFIALRKDTAVVLSTHDASLGENHLPLSDQRAIAVALKTRLKLTPESDYFGTPVMRGVVLAGTGIMPDGSTKDRIPLTYSLALKSAKMMGAGNGKWKRVELFDKAPGNILKELIDPQPGFIPAGVKPVLWNDGIVWAQPYDREQYHFPGIQTIYDNDTSVLNSYFTVMAICTLNKIAQYTWRNYTGSTALSQAEFAEEVVNFVNLNLKDRFADMYTIIPEVVFTNADEQRGYSWHLIIKIYAANMKTVMVSEIHALRSSDLAG